MQKTNYQPLLVTGKQIGFSAVVLLSFLGGVYWSMQSDGDADENGASEPFPLKNTARSGSSLADPRFGTKKPEQEDFYPVAEFRQQSALLIGCYNQLNTDPNLYVEIAKALDRRLPVFGLVDSEAQAARGYNLMIENGLPEDAIHFLPLPSNTIWIRDYAPFMVRRKDSSIAMIDAKYINRESEEKRILDEEMAGSLASLLKLPIRSIPISVEGGNILSNGDGSIFSTAKILDVNKGYQFTQNQILEILSDSLGIRRLTYVRAMEGEVTGHIDMFATVLAKNIMVVGDIPKEQDPENHERLNQAVTYFSQVTTSLGPMQVHRIPTPHRWGGNWRSYTNVIMANGILLMPSFSDVPVEIENQAVSIYEQLLPGWEVKKILCDSLVKEEGQLHCISYNLPNYVSLDGLYEKSYRPPSNKNLSKTSILRKSFLK